MDDMNFDPTDIAKIRQMQALGPLQANNQAIGVPMQSFQQMPSPLDRSGGEDSPGLSQGPPPPMGRAPAVVGPPKPVPQGDDEGPADAGDNLVADDDAAKGFQKDSPLKDLMVTKDDLDKANKRKKIALALGMMGEALANNQSAGNFYLGRMNPHHDVQAFGQKLAGMADAPIEQKRVLLAQELKQPEMELAMRSADPTSTESSLMGNMMKANVQNNEQLSDDQKAGMLKNIEGKSAAELNQIAKSGPWSQIMADNKLFQTLNNKVDIANARAEALKASYQGRNDYQQGRLDVMRGNLGARLDQQAISAGNHIEADSTMKQSRNSLNSLQRSQSILDNTSKPVTSYDLNLAYNDYINAVANGGVATEGKIHREMPQNFEVEWNALKGKVGEFDDLRKTAAGQKLIEMLKNNMGKVHNDLTDAMARRNKDLTENLSQSSNPKVRAIAEKKDERYQTPPDVTQPTTVQMKDPKGNIRSVPSDQVEAAKAAGGTVVNGQ